jgi:hypothetical protein
MVASCASEREPEHGREPNKKTKEVLGLRPPSLLDWLQPRPVVQEGFFAFVFLFLISIA